MTLAAEGSLPEGMVRVPGGSVALPDRVVNLEDFFIDRFEVTNRDFKKFMDAGGYRNPAYWQEPFVKDGHPVAYDEAMREFRDATGRPGPSTWELGHYPEGQDDYPVSGVSWYEAAAYARFAGKQLPTAHHWRVAAGTAAANPYSEILAVSNFSGKGPAKVGRYQGVGPYGTYDMAGNVKEWCWNAVRDKRYILGGAWNEPSYVFRDGDALAGFDRGPGNGFRCVKLAGSAPVPESATRPIERFERDYSLERPVSDDVFRIYKDLYSYDRADLKPTIESTDDTSPFWRVERISYAAAYGNERIVAHLFLPKNAKPPYQTVMYVPTAEALFLRSFEEAELSYLGFTVKSGRALLLPMYKGTYERRLAAPPAGPNAQRDLTIQRVKDVRRSVDYLETRNDIDRSKIAYFGVSFGATLAPIPLAVENRFKTAVLWSGGFPLTTRLPEIDPINFAPRVTIPVLMLNGRDDFTFPVTRAHRSRCFRLSARRHRTSAACCSTAATCFRSPASRRTRWSGWISISGRRSSSRVERALEQFVHAFGVGLPRRGLHHLPDEEAEGAGLAAAVIGHRTRIRRQDFRDQRDDLRLVVDLRESFGRDDRVGRPIRRVHLLEDALGHRPADRALLDQRDEPGQPLRRQQRRGDVGTVLVQDARELAHDPVARRLRGRPGLDRRLEVVGEAARLRQLTRVILRQAERLDEPAAPRVRQLGHRQPNPLDPFGVDETGGRSGSGKYR